MADSDSLSGPLLQYYISQNQIAMGQVGAQGIALGMPACEVAEC